MKKINKSHYNVGDLVIITITRFGFIAGETLTVTNPNKIGKDKKIEVTARNKTRLVPSKYLDD